MKLDTAGLLQGGDKHYYNGRSWLPVLSLAYRVGLAGCYNRISKDGRPIVMTRKEERVILLKTAIRHAVTSKKWPGHGAHA